MSTRNGTRATGRTTPKRPRPTKLAELPPPVPETPAAPLVDPPAGKLRLLKVAVQPTFVLVDDDGSVQEILHPAVEIKGVDWAAWSADVFTDEALEGLRQTITPVQQT